MYRECRHIKDDGLRCRAGALKGKPYCFFHMKLKHMQRRSNIEIPPIEDATSVVLAIGQVMRLLTLDTMELKRAGLMLYGLQIASSVIKQREQADGAEYVRSVHNEAGEPIDVSQAYNFETRAFAPESTVCEPPQDCATCEQKTSCTRRAQLQKDNAKEGFSDKGIASAPVPPALSTSSAISSRLLPEGATENSPGQAQRSPGIAPRKSSSPVGPSETRSKTNFSSEDPTQPNNPVASHPASGHNVSRAAKSQNATRASAPAFTSTDTTDSPTLDLRIRKDIVSNSQPRPMTKIAAKSNLAPDETDLPQHPNELVSNMKLAETQIQVPPLRCAPVGMTQ